ncbi:hypothetical protein T10_24 [Trichinella papuae]|uniref:Uncharacterized protein n=1 Tax=Trichinella papuae TaxID=268474 RepID=A0A0V1N1Z4_9BILA|nr:hypothetical protein T10_4516 [Trichinella papuae]KRZ77856.1 hypothetical protein T10_24 [Trichinella papuae]
MSNAATLSTSIVLVGAARRSMVQLATTVTSRLLISVRLSGHSAFASPFSERCLGPNVPWQATGHQASSTVGRHAAISRSAASI